MKNFRILFISRLLPVILISLLGYGPVEAQETGSCAEKLKSAQTSFARGQTEAIPSLLTHCLSTGGFKREEEIAAYKLLIQTYLLNDKLDQADSAMFAFLKRNPEYQVSETDHSSFVYLYNNFNVKQVLQISVRAGTSYPFLTFIDENPTGGVPVESNFATDATNLYLSAEVKIRVAKKLEASLELGYSQLQFINSGSYMDLGEFSYTENIKRLEIPVSINYDFLTFGGKFTAFGRAGIGTALNLSTTADAVLYMNDRLNQDKTGGTQNRNDARSVIDIFGQIGGGVKYKISKGFFFAELRTSLGMINQNKNGGLNIASNEHNQWYYYYRDPDFHLNTLSFNVGWTYIFYKPSKRVM